MTAPTDLKLLFTHPPSFPEKFADGFATERDELLQEVLATHEKIAAIKRSGHYSGKGEAAEIGAALGQLAKVRKAFTAKTVEKIAARIHEDTTAALQPKPITEDPSLRFQRLLAKRAKLETQDPIDLEVRLRQAVVNGGSEELIAALELLEPEFPIAPKALIETTKRAIAERTHPELGEFAQLKTAYAYLAGVVSQEIQTIAEREHVSLTADASTEPYLLSTGQPAPAPVKT